MKGTVDAILKDPPFTVAYPILTSTLPIQFKNPGLSKHSWIKPGLPSQSLSIQGARDCLNNSWIQPGYAITIPSNSRLCTPTKVKPNVVRLASKFDPRNLFNTLQACKEF